MVIIPQHFTLNNENARDNLIIFLKLLELESDIVQGLLVLKGEY